MLQEHEIDGIEQSHQLELDAPAATSPAAALQAKPGSLTGALVQRGRERSPRLAETSIPSESVAPELVALPAPEPAPLLPKPVVRVPATPRRTSRWADALFAAACCVAFFASFLFVLRF